jgi:hypothetical protein
MGDMDVVTSLTVVTDGLRRNATLDLEIERSLLADQNTQWQAKVLYLAFRQRQRDYAVMLRCLARIVVLATDGKEWNGLHSRYMELETEFQKRYAKLDSITGGMPHACGDEPGESTQVKE